MTPELVFVREEIQALNERWADVQMLDSLCQQYRLYFIQICKNQMTLVYWINMEL